jgi:CheY-like chemotaxis protein
LRGALSQHGEPFELTILQNGEAALRFIADHRSGIRPPRSCVIALDLNLPKHDGLAVLAALKAERGVSHIKVLVVGVLTSPEIQVLLRAMGGLCREKPSDGPGWLALAAELITFCHGRQRPRVDSTERLSRGPKKPCADLPRTKNPPIVQHVQEGGDRALLLRVSPDFEIKSKNSTIR